MKRLTAQFDVDEGKRQISVKYSRCPRNRDEDFDAQLEAFFGGASRQCCHEDGRYHCPSLATPESGWPTHPRRFGIDCEEVPS